jgi:hypothetical protein
MYSVAPNPTLKNNMPLPAHLDACQVEQRIARLATRPDRLSGLDAAQADWTGGVVTAACQVLLHTQ